MTTVSIRASDAEREEVTALLQRAVAEGRLTPEEGGERLAAASAARYRDELGRLVRDLPAIIETASSSPVPRRPTWIAFAGRLVRGAVFAAAFAAFVLWGIGLFLPFWIFGLMGLAFALRGRTRWHRVIHRRGWDWYGSPGRFRPSSLPW